MPSRRCLGLPGKPCTNLTTRGSRCTTCQAEKQRAINASRTHYHGTYQTRRAKLRAQWDSDPTTRCWLCRGLAREDDPWTVDHVTPADPDSELRPAHASCNSRRGNRR